MPRKCLLWVANHLRSQTARQKCHCRANSVEEYYWLTEASATVSVSSRHTSSGAASSLSSKHSKRFRSSSRRFSRAVVSNLKRRAAFMRRRGRAHTVRCLFEPHCKPGTRSRRRPSGTVLQCAVRGPCHKGVLWVLDSSDENHKAVRRCEIYQAIAISAPRT